MSGDEVCEKLNLTKDETQKLKRLDYTETLVPLIWAYINVLLDQDQWVHKPHAAFAGKPALQVMLEGDIKKVKEYLAYILYGE